MSFVSDFIASVKRIYTVSKKPSTKEFLEMAKITGLGIVVIGFLGFVIIFLFHYFGI